MHCLVIYYFSSAELKIGIWLFALQTPSTKVNHSQNLFVKLLERAVNHP